jgi:hypothetical protein
VKPTLGRIVHYVLAEADSFPNAGIHRPAIIVEPYSAGNADPIEGESWLNLAIFTSASDGLPLTYSRMIVPYSAGGLVRGSWHWPEDA